MNSSPLAFPPPRVAPHALHALGGIWRLTFRRYLMPSHWLALGGLLAVLVLLAYPALRSAGSGGRQYLEWVIDVYLLLLAPLMAFISAASAIRDELKGGTVDYIFTRPVRRPAFIGFKYLAHVTCAQLDFLAAFAVALGIGLYRGIPFGAEVAICLFIAQVIVVGVFSALGFLCGVLTSRYVLLGLGYAAVIEVGIGQIPTPLSRLSITHQVREMLGPLTDPLANYSWTFGSLATAGAGLLATTLFLGLAAAIFSWQELAGPGEA